MSGPIVEIDNLSKLYRLGAIGYTTLRESLSEWYARRRGRPHGAPPAAGIDPAQAGPHPRTFWALRDVSAAIQRGETVGIIGRNGAGKSTLLKILLRITDPTRGRAAVRGRVGSLLEVGTGFHPELTGRENIFLNGAILGMRKADIAGQLDGIIDFADVGGFIDTPVKRYSSGMYVRLAFAVAAHLEPDVLVVDELLAVGDIRFQRKCLGKMQEMSTAQGRTVLFVSHNLEAVQRLCTRCLLLDRGRLLGDGPTQSIVAEYLGGDLDTATAGKWIDVATARREGTGEARFAELRLSSGNEVSAGQLYSDGPVEIALAIDARTPTRAQSVAIGFRDELGRKLVNADIGALGQTIELPGGRTIVRLRIRELHLKPGVYSLALWLARYAGDHVGGADVIDFVEKAVDVEVVEITSQGFRTSLRGAEVVTCDFELLDIFHQA